jgi:integrase
MSLYRRCKNGVWWVRFTAPGGRRIRQTTGTVDRTKAQEYHDRLRVELWRVSKLGDKPRRTWQQAVARYLREVAHKAGYEEDNRQTKWLDQYWRDKYLDEITREAVEQVKAAKLSTGVANATCNRMLAVVRAVLRKSAYDWEWIDRIPKVRLLPEPKRRIRFITRDEAARLIAVLPKHLAEVVRFSLATGLRKRNVTELQWSQVDLERRCAWVHPDQAKARKAIAVPLNAEAMLVLRRQQGKHPVYVFCYRKHAPLSCVNGGTWREAVKRVGLADFRWHDLRHTWASWHVQQGTPLHALQELGGWETAEMVRRYAHLAPEHLAEYAERLAKPRVVDSSGTNLAQAEKRT